jgi:alkylation response protein AidB-like acyl-CoA dehydrogenase
MLDIAAEIYGPKDVVHGGVFAPNGRAEIDGDDFVINGTWQWASGSPNCTWLTGGAIVYENGEMQKQPTGAPNARQTLFPASEATLGDDWYVNGLCGTGSGSMTVENVRIPQKHSVSLTMDKQQFGGPLYVFPSFGLLALGIATVALGNARGAISDLVELADGKTPQGARKVLAQRVHSQIELAQATAALRGARAYLEDSIGQAWEEARNDGKISTEARCHIRLACTHGTKTAANVSRVMYELGGGSSLFLASPLQRRFRDAYAATQHMMVAPPTLELTGRILMGVETDLTFL